MRTLLILLSALLLLGCQSYQLDTPDGLRLSVQRFATDAEVGTLKAGRNEHGIYLELEGVKSETEKVAGAVVEAAVRGAVGN